MPWASFLDMWIWVEIVKGLQGTRLQTSAVGSQGAGERWDTEDVIGCIAPRPAVGETAKWSG